MIPNRNFEITPQLISSIDHAGLSNNKATSVILSVAHYLGIDASEVPISSSTVWRHRNKVREQISTEIKATFGQNIDNAFIVLHWDGKILPKWSVVDGNSDKLAIVVSMGKETKVLGVADLPNGNALAQFHAVKAQTEEWQLEGFIKAVCSDMASVNTGEENGTCHLFREHYNDNILTLACRHHMLELVSKAAYTKALNDISSSPNIELFVRFRARWNEIDKSKIQNGIQHPTVKQYITEPEKTEIVAFIRNQLTMQKEFRKDYIELLELSLFFLGETEIDGKEIQIRTPGAVHRARFMARVIYSLKIFAFRAAFDLNGKSF